MPKIKSVEPQPSVVLVASELESYVSELTDLRRTSVEIKASLEAKENLCRSFTDIEKVYLEDFFEEKGTTIDVSDLSGSLLLQGYLQNVVVFAKTTASQGRSLFDRLMVQVEHAIATDSLTVPERKSVIANLVRVNELMQKLATSNRDRRKASKGKY